MSEAKIAQKGPYVLKETAGKKWWCACGYSQNQPYCDGSHDRLKTGIGPIPMETTEGKIVVWCGCKHSGTPPFCDGTHAEL